MYLSEKLLTLLISRMQTHVSGKRPCGQMSTTFCLPGIFNKNPSFTIFFQIEYATISLKYCYSWRSPRFLCRSTAFFSTCWSRGTSESSTYGKQRICRFNSASTHFHVSWLSDFIFYPKPLYKSLHQSFLYSFITSLPSESGVTLHYSTILPQTIISLC